MERTFLIAANWKMNPPPEGAFAHDSPYQTHAAVDVIVFATPLDLRDCIAAKLITGGQYGHPSPTGANTGDVSMAMLAKVGCRYVLCGHSERRRDHHETNELVAQMATAALEVGMHPVICVGETREERDAGKAQAVVKAQMAPLPTESDITIAYEPRWAIGTGITPAPQDAQKMHAYIRSLLPADRRSKTRILYGGSLEEKNAHSFLSLDDIDGGLIGGASLKPAVFRAIVDIASQLRA